MSSIIMGLAAAYVAGKVAEGVVNANTAGFDKEIEKAEKEFLSAHEQYVKSLEELSSEAKALFN